MRLLKYRDYTRGTIFMSVDPLKNFPYRVIAFQKGSGTVTRNLDFVEFAEAETYYQRLNSQAEAQAKAYAERVAA